MKQTLSQSAPRTSKLLIAACAMALGFALFPAGATAEPAPDHDRGQQVERKHRDHRDGRRYDRRDRDHRSRAKHRREAPRRYDSRYRAPRHDRRVYRDRAPRYDRQHYYRPAPRHFSIPHRLLRSHLRALHEFFFGRIFYRAHNHFHMVYDFPVYYDHRVTYERRAYCQGDLYDQPYRDSEYDYDYYDD
jgi:hypothetical protein